MIFGWPTQNIAHAQKMCFNVKIHDDCGIILAGCLYHKTHYLFSGLPLPLLASQEAGKKETAKQVSLAVSFFPASCKAKRGPGNKVNNISIKNKLQNIDFFVNIEPIRSGNVSKIHDICTWSPQF